MSASQYFGNSDTDHILSQESINSNDADDDNYEIGRTAIKGDTTSLDQHEKQKNRTINILYFNMLISSISFSIVMSSLWPYLRKIDPNVTETFLGWVNAVFSFGVVFCAILFGYWSDRRPSKEPLLASNILLFLGSGLYVYADAFGKNGIYVVLVARLILGFSAGNISVARSVATQLSTKDTRTKVMSFLSFYQAFGFFVGPALQAATKPIGTKGLYIPSIKFTLSIYSAPLIVMLFSIVNGVLLVLFFRENQTLKAQTKEENTRLKRASVSFQPLDKTVLFITLIIWFVLMSDFTLTETILAPVMMNEYAWTRATTVFYGAIVLSVSGVLCLLCFMLVIPLTKKFSDRVILLGGFILTFIAFLTYLPWGPGYPKLTPPSSANISEPVGCPREYEWCHNTPLLPLPQLITAMVLGTVGYCFASVAHNVLYSKIIGPYPQGRYMGWLSGAGGVARIAGPLYVTAVYQHFGLRWSLAGVQALLLTALLLIFCFWKRLVPYGEYQRKISLPAKV